MEKTCVIERDKKRRRMVKSLANKRAKLKAIIKDRNAPADERFRATLALAELPRNSSKTRIRNRCALTGRPRGYYRKLGLSRIALRQLASQGTLPGVVKSSW